MTNGLQRSTRSLGNSESVKLLFTSSTRFPPFITVNTACYRSLFFLYSAGVHLHPTESPHLADPQKDHFLVALSNLSMPKQMVFNMWYLVRVIVRYASLETHCTRFGPDGCRLSYMRSCHLSGCRDASIGAPGEGGCRAWEQCMQLLISRLPTRFC